MMNSKHTYSYSFILPKSFDLEIPIQMQRFTHRSVGFSGEAKGRESAQSNATSLLNRGLKQTAGESRFKYTIEASGRLDLSRSVLTQGKTLEVRSISVGNAWGSHLLDHETIIEINELFKQDCWTSANKQIQELIDSRINDLLSAQDLRDSRRAFRRPRAPSPTNCMKSLMLGIIDSLRVLHGLFALVCVKDFLCTAFSYSMYSGVSDEDMLSYFLQGADLKQETVAVIAAQFEAAGVDIRTELVAEHFFPEYRWYLGFVLYAYCAVKLLAYCRNKCQ